MRVKEFVSASHKLEGREPFETYVETIDDVFNPDWLQRRDAEEYKVRGSKIMGKFGNHWQTLAIIEED